MTEENSGLVPVPDHELFQATTARGFEAGRLIFGRFVLERILGRGGMGIVWLAHDNQLEQEVAIKVLPDVVMHDREAVGDMKRETKRSLQLNHHNIVRIYDFNQDESVAGISMEFVDGETLSAAKSERPHGCFDVEDVAPWLEQICDALSYAHNTVKIVHRDLKPANIMLSSNNTIKVTDFGIARSISDSISRVSMRHASAGTMVYMSPQQSSGARSSSSDDIYALGATIYDLLTGKPPFYSGNIQHQLENITPSRMEERRVELERYGNSIPEHWEQAVAACLEKEPSRRPSSVHDLAERLGLRTATTYATASPSTSSPAAVLTPRYSPPITPASPSGPGWFTPARIQMIGIGAGCCAAIALVAGLIFFFSRGSGTVAITTIPPGAMVSIEGVQKTSPAVFDAVPSGQASAAIALDGYDPIVVPAKVMKNERTDLGMIPLTRSTGGCTITLIPQQATCRMRFAQSPVPDETSGGNLIATFPGTQPWQSTILKTGKYELTTSADGFPEEKDEIEIKSGSTSLVTVDLVKEVARQALSPEEVAAVSSTDPLPDQLQKDGASKARLLAYYDKTFHGYLRIGEFNLAADQLKLAGDLGASTDSGQKELENARLIAEKGQGAVAVKTDPAGAIVSLNGLTQSSPALFNKVLSGLQTVKIELSGYDEADVPAQVNRDALTDLGITNLVRSTGSVEITAIPRDANCTLKLVHSDATAESPGVVATFSTIETYKAAALGTGIYAVTVARDGFSSADFPLEIKKGDKLNFTADLVKEGALHLLTPDQVAIVNGDHPIPATMKQDPAAKASLTAYYQQIEQSYIQLKEFKLAESSMHHLSDDLGVATDEQQLNQLEAEWMTGQKANLTQLIQQERFTEADAMLADMESHGPQPELHAALSQAKQAHEDSVNKALSTIDALEKAGNDSSAYEAAVAASNQDKIELRLALRVANLELSMASTYERVTNRLRALKALDANLPTPGANGELARLVNIFQKNSDQHASFRAQIASLEKSAGSFNSKIASLRAAEKQDQDKANGYKALNIFSLAGVGGAASQNNGAGVLAGLGAASVGANGANAREGDVQRIEAQINSLKSQQSTAESELREARQNYEAFTQGPISATD